MFFHDDCRTLPPRAAAPGRSRRPGTATPSWASTAPGTATSPPGTRWSGSRCRATAGPTLRRPSICSGTAREGRGGPRGCARSTSSLTGAAGCLSPRTARDPTAPALSSCGTSHHRRRRPPSHPRPPRLTRQRRSRCAPRQAFRCLRPRRWLRAPLHRARQRLGLPTGQHGVRHGCQRRHRCAWCAGTAMRPPQARHPPQAVAAAPTGAWMDPPMTMGKKGSTPQLLPS